MSDVLIQTCREGKREWDQLHPVTLTHSISGAHADGGWMSSEKMPIQLKTPMVAQTCWWPRHRGARGRSGCSYLFPEFSSDVAEPLGSIEAHGFQAPVSQHFQHLSVLCKNKTGMFNLPGLPGYIWTAAEPVWSFMVKECKNIQPEKVFKVNYKMIYNGFSTQTGFLQTPWVHK